MSFSPEVAEELLVKSARHCCLCRKFKGTKIEVHHIIPLAKGGSDNPDNGIPLCFDCHADVMSYNAKHPKGRKFHSEELKKHRDQWFILAQTRGALSDGKQTMGIEIPVSSSIIQKNKGNGNLIVGENVNFNPRIVVKNSVSPGPEHITDKQALEVRELINEIAKMNEQAGRLLSYKQWYAKLYKKFKITSYKLIPLDQLAEVKSWLHQQKAMQRPTLRRSNNSAWRKSIYTAIYAKANELGIDKSQLYQITYQKLKLNKPVNSLKELGERNLEKLRIYLFGLQRPLS
jgi:hypothetical protein